MKNKWRLIISGRKDLYYNMALDEYLFRSYTDYNKPVFRIYGWHPGAFTIGNNQRAEKVLYLDKCKEDNIAFVRRMTGGSVIYHADEITYSIICSDADIDNNEGIKNSYKILCSFIIEMYKMLGLDAYYSIDDKNYEIRKGLSNYCFSAWEEYDIVVKGKKIGGNAQRRNRNIILQHGSIPIGLNLDKIKKYVHEIPDDFYDRTVSLNDLINNNSYNEIENKMIDSFKNIMNVDFYKEEFNDNESLIVEDLINIKYKSNNWNFFKKDEYKEKANEFPNQT